MLANPHSHTVVFPSCFIRILILLALVFADCREDYTLDQTPQTLSEQQFCAIDNASCSASQLIKVQRRSVSILSDNNETSASHPSQDSRTIAEGVVIRLSKSEVSQGQSKALSTGSFINTTVDVAVCKLS